MIRDGRHKLVACPGDPDQLYDLAEDPAERLNLAAEPQHRPTLTALRGTLAARWDLDALGTRVLASQRERHLVGRALEQGANTSWDFEPSVDASTRYVRSRADLYALQRRSRLEAQE
jgi:choline-sulfatase